MMNRKLPYKYAVIRYDLNTFAAIRRLASVSLVRWTRSREREVTPELKVALELYIGIHGGDYAPSFMNRIGLRRMFLKDILDDAIPQLIDSKHEKALMAVRSIAEDITKEE